jgi:hypothetical protein
MLEVCQYMPVVNVHKALKDGFCRQIAESRKTLESALLRNAVYKRREHGRWSFEVEIADVPFVNADYVVDLDGDGKGYPHAFWTCPVCGELQITDITPFDASPAVWFSHCRDISNYVQPNMPSACAARLGRG